MFELRGGNISERCYTEENQDVEDLVIEDRNVNVYECPTYTCTQRS